MILQTHSPVFFWFKAFVSCAVTVTTHWKSRINTLGRSAFPDNFIPCYSFQKMHFFATMLLMTLVQTSCSEQARKSRYNTNRQRNNGLLLPLKRISHGTQISSKEPDDQEPIHSPSFPWMPKSQQPENIDMPSSKRSTIFHELERMKQQGASICSLVCDHCKSVTSRSISSLCLGDCQHGGGTYLVCVAFWNTRYEIPEPIYFSRVENS